MADNINVSEGSGKTVATEEIGSSQYQRIKVVGGQTGSTSVMGVNPDGSINVSVVGALNFSPGNSSTITVAKGSVAVVIIGGSIAASFTPPANQSVSGAVTAPPGSVMTVNQLAGSVLAVSGSFSPAGNQSVSGAVTAPPGSIATVVFPAGSVTAVTFAAAANQSVSGAITAPPGSVMTVATLAGSIVAVSGAVTAPAGSVMNTVSPAGSVTAVRTDLASVITTQIAGSVMAISGAVTAVAGSIATVVNPAGSVTAVRTDNASVIGVDTVVGSVITLIQAASIVGTYAEDAASASGDKGLLVMGARNDTLSSVTSADGDYSSHVVGPSGELIAANAPFTKWIAGTGDLRVVLGTSVQVLAAQGTSIFTYITGVQVANLGPASVLVTLAGGLGSILGYTIAPAGGGSNIVYPNALKTGENSKFTASLSGTASVLVSAQGFIAKI